MINKKLNEILEETKKTHNVEILNKIIELFSISVKSHNKTFIIRFDINFPEDYKCKKEPSKYISDLLTRFNEFYKNKNKIYYLWAREQNDSDHPHYHMVLFLNGDLIQNDFSIHKKLDEIWQRKLWNEIKKENGSGLINQSIDWYTKKRNNTRQYRRTTDLNKIEFADIIYWLKYLAKNKTKGKTPKNAKRFSCSFIPKHQDI